MGGRKLSNLTEVTDVGNGSLFYIVDPNRAVGDRSVGMDKNELSALVGTSPVTNTPVENQYADITALLADQGNQTTSFFNHVKNASADPNISSGSAYYEKLATSTSTLADDYRLLSDNETDALENSEDKYNAPLATSGTVNIDWSLYDTWNLTLLGDMTLTESNLPTTGVNTKVINIYAIGDFNLNFPSDWTTNQRGSYDGTVLNRIRVEYLKNGLYWVDIQQASTPSTDEYIVYAMGAISLFDVSGDWMGFDLNYHASYDSAQWVSLGSSNELTIYQQDLSGTPTPAVFTAPFDLEIVKVIISSDNATGQNFKFSMGKCLRTNGSSTTTNASTLYTSGANTKLIATEWGKWTYDSTDFGTLTIEEGYSFMFLIAWISGSSNLRLNSIEITCKKA